MIGGRKMIEDTRTESSFEGDGHTLRWAELKDELPNLDYSMRRLARELSISPTYLCHMMNGQLKVTSRIAKEVQRLLDIEIVDRPIDLEEKFLDVCKERDYLASLVSAAMQSIKHVPNTDLDNPYPIEIPIWEGHVPSILVNAIEYGDAHEVRHWTTPTTEESNKEVTG